jgi:uncharacterized repeat protein (TIGR02543 family)
MNRRIIVFFSFLLFGLVTFGLTLYVALTSYHTYTITIVPNDGTATYQERIKDGSYFSVGEVSKDGYVFDGWFLNSNYSVALDPYEPVTSDFTVYAKFSEIYYDITYVLPVGVNNSPNNPISYTVNFEPIVLDNPQGTGTFVGWFDSYNTETGVIGNVVTTILPSHRAPVTVYAVFADFLVNYRVEHLLEQVDGSYIIYQIDNIPSLLGSSVNPVLLNLLNYVTPIVDGEIVGTNTVIRVEYKLVRHLVTYYGYHNELLRQVEVPHGSSAYVPDLPNVLGYIAIGWDGVTTNVTEDLVLHAIYQPRTDIPYLVVYLIDGSEYGVVWLSGTADSWVFPPIIEIEGYVPPEYITSYQIAPDGSLVIVVSYTLES